MENLGNLFLIFTNIIVLLLYFKKIRIKYFNLILILILSESLVLLLYQPEVISPSIALFSVTFIFLILLSNFKDEVNPNSKLLISFVDYNFFNTKSNFMVYSFLILIILFDLSNNSMSDFGVCLFLLLLLHSGINISPINFRDNHEFEIKFAYFFIIFLSLTLGIYSSILILYNFSSGGLFSLAIDFFLEVLLMRPLSNVLSLLGIQTHYIGNVLYYPDSTLMLTSQVNITNECSGLYSVFIFISCFLSYVLINSYKFNIELFYIALFGIFLSYISNILRMAIIVYVGHLYGNDALYWTHKNVGWFLFVLWFLLFWKLFMQYYDKPTEGVDK